MRISDWSSDVCSSDLLEASLLAATDRPALASGSNHREITLEMIEQAPSYEARANLVRAFVRQDSARAALVVRHLMQRSEEHTSELQSLMRISYAVFCLKKKKSNH